VLRSQSMEPTSSIVLNFFASASTLPSDLGQINPLRLSVLIGKVRTTIGQCLRVPIRTVLVKIWKEF
jgi:hypothetical protein